MYRSGISEYHSLVVRRRKRNTRYDDNTDGYVQEGVTLTGRERVLKWRHILLLSTS